MLVWSGASDHTIFDDKEVNWAFRAWHDWCHWKYNLPFTPDGEAMVAHIQQDHIRLLYGSGEQADYFCDIIDAEINGQIAYSNHHGEFPVDQKAFVRHYLNTQDLTIKF